MTWMEISVFGKETIEPQGNKGCEHKLALWQAGIKCNVYVLNQALSLIQS